MKPLGLRHQWLNSHKNGNATKSNVMTPLNWFVGIVELLLITGCIAAAREYVAVTCMALIVLILVFYMAIYLLFALRNPDRLQSETYNIKMKEFTLFKQVDNSPPEMGAEDKIIPLTKTQGSITFSSKS